MGPGLYMITDLDLDSADPRFKRIISCMDNPFKNNCVYACPLLRLLDAYGAKYRITYGIWAGGRSNTIDMRFNDKAMANKAYAVIVGIWAHLTHSKKFYMRGTKQMARLAATHAPHANVYWEPLTDVDVRHDDDEETGNISVSYPSKHVFHSSQLTAYINAYECCLMVDQLMEMDLDKVVQVQKDDILYVDHETNILPFMRDKTLYELTRDKLEAKAAWYDTAAVCPYLSNVHEACCLTNEHRALVDEFRARFSHISHTVAPVVCHIGAGGTGKTDDALRDPTRLRCIYIAPYNRLIHAKAAEYKRDLTGAEELERLETRVVGLQKGDRKSLVPMADQSINVTLSTRALHANIEIYSKIAHLTNTLVCDEVQLWGREACLLMLERYPHHEIIFAGDPGRQLGVISNETCKSSEFDLHETYPVIRFDRIFRVKCDRLMAIRMEGRRMLDAGADINAIRAFYMRHFPVLRTHKDVAAAYQAFTCVDGRYEPKDMPICSTNELRREWTEYLTPLQPFDENGVALQKYTIKSTSGTAVRYAPAGCFPSICVCKPALPAKTAPDVIRLALDNVPPAVSSTGVNGWRIAISLSIVLIFVVRRVLPSS